MELNTKIALGAGIPLAVLVAAGATMQILAEVCGKTHNAVHWTIVRSQFAYFAHNYGEDVRKEGSELKKAFEMAENFVKNPTREETFFAVSKDNGVTWEFTTDIKDIEGAAELVDVDEDEDEPKKESYTGEDAGTAFNAAHKTWEEQCAANKKTRDENADKLKAFKKGKFYKANWSAVLQLMKVYNAKQAEASKPEADA